MHLGLGNFFRAHQAWYTEHAPDAGEWGIAAFTGRSASPLVDDLSAQDGLYTLVTRAADGDRFDVIAQRLARARRGRPRGAGWATSARPTCGAVTLTVTEAGYLRGADGGLDARPARGAGRHRGAARATSRAPVRTAPARLVAGIAARRRADAGPLAIVPCDNLAGQRRARARASSATSPSCVDAGLLAWLDESVSFVTTMVDRITPRTTPEDVQAVRDATGRRRPLPGRHRAVQGMGPQRRLPGRAPALGGRRRDVHRRHRRRSSSASCGCSTARHSLLAYAGSIRGHETVADAVADDTCRAWVEQWWAEASRHLTSRPRTWRRYRAALLERFANARMRDRLAQIADGRLAEAAGPHPARAAGRAGAGRMPEGAARVLAAWVCHLRGARRAGRRRAGRRGRPARRRPARARRSRACSSGWIRGSRTTKSWSRPVIGQSEQLAATSPRTS